MSHTELTEPQLKAVLTAAMDVGRALLKSGADVRRVEDTINRICSAYGCTQSDVFSITTEIIASAESGNASASLTRRVRHYSYNLKRLEELNALSRSICSCRPDPSGVKAQVEDIMHHSELSPFKKFAGFLLGSAGFAVFFGGNLVDAIASLFTAVIIFVIDYFFKRGRMNMLAYTVTAACVAGFVDVGLKRLFPFLNVDAVIIGNVMLLIPGFGLTNGARDLLGGDIVSGLLRLSEAILVSIAVAAGFAIPLLVLGGV